MKDLIEDAIKSTVGKIKSDNGSSKYIGMKYSVRQAVDYFQVAMFPSYNGQVFEACRSCSESSDCKERPEEVRRTEALRRASDNLIKALSCLYSFKEACDFTEKLILKIPDIMEILSTDINAAYEGDPAASSVDEVILAYPAFPAISIFRLAHELYIMGISTVPRMMTEYAHELTGIDIHPGATIGSYFFIDHGTGVVVGETCTIGNHVKLYQHVTLGAKSFDTLPDGSLVKGIKRHPDIGDNVVIYAGATILGGDTKIGDNSIIGGNVWLTHSVDANQTVVR